MNIKSRIAPLLLAGIVALSIATVPAVAADAATSGTQAKAKTGTVVVQLLDLKGKVLKKRVGVGLATANAGNGATTNSKGVVTFTKVSPGSRYTVSAGYSSVYAIAQKTSVKVTAGKTTKISLKLAIGATIRGTVRDAEGATIAGAYVAVLNKAGDVVGDTHASSKGAYAFTGLNTGSYKVGFNNDTYADAGDFDGWDSGYNTTYWKNATTFKSATFVKVTQQTTKKAASATKSINGTLTAIVVPAQTLTGTVAIEGADSVIVTNLDTEATTTVDVTDGSFSADLPIGDYQLSTEVADADDNVWTYWYAGDDAAASLDQNEAATITLTEDDAVDVTFNAPSSQEQPAEDVTVSGTIALEGAWYVYFQDADGTEVGSAAVEGGAFETSLPEGDYTATAAVLQDDSVWWYTGDDEAASLDESDAVTFTVSADPEATNAISFGGQPL